MGYDKNSKKWSNFSLVLINMCRNTQDLETIYQRSILGRPPLVLTTLLWVIVLKEKWTTFASFSRSMQIIFLRVRFFKNLRTFFGDAPYLQYIYTTVYLFIYFVCLNFIFLLTIVEHDNIGILRRVHWTCVITDWITVTFPLYQNSTPLTYGFEVCTGSFLVSISWMTFLNCK